MKTVVDKHGGGHVVQYEWIWRRSRFGPATDEIKNDGDGEIVWKDGDGLGKY